MSSADRSSDVSRLSKTNRADDESGTYGPSAGESLKQPLTERGGVRLREEVRSLLSEHDRAARWGTSLRAYRRYLEDKREPGKPVFEHVEDGTVAVGEAKPHRFDPAYSDKQYAKLKDLERGVREAYGRRLHTAMLTLTCSSTRDDGTPKPPVDHLNELDQSWEAVRRALSRSLDGRRWCRIAILEPHQSGYLHIHVAVFVDGIVTREDFAPAIEAHLRNCPGAGREAHDVEDDTTISIRHAGGDRDVEDGDSLDEIAIYLGEYLGVYGEDDPLDQDEHVQMANTVLWATGKQRWRPCQEAQKYMAADNRLPSGEWELIAIEDENGDEHPVTGVGGGVAAFVTDEPPPDVEDDPPPD